MMRDLTESRKTPFGTPIPWIAEPVTKFGSVQAPAYGAGNQVTILTYVTPQNFYSLICGVVLGFAGGIPTPLPGDLIFTVDIDTPLGQIGVGNPEKDFGSVQQTIGSFTPGPPWPVEWRHKNGETLRIKGQTVAHVQTLPGNFLTAAIIGWQWPLQGWE
jgi:hypothetical protein